MVSNNLCNYCKSRTELYFAQPLQAGVKQSNFPCNLSHNAGENNSLQVATGTLPCYLGLQFAIVQNIDTAVAKAGNEL